MDSKIGMVNATTEAEGESDVGAAEDESDTPGGEAVRVPPPVAFSFVIAPGGEAAHAFPPDAFVIDDDEGSPPGSPPAATSDATSPPAYSPPGPRPAASVPTPPQVPRTPLPRGFLLLRMLPLFRPPPSERLLRRRLLRCPSVRSDTIPPDGR